MVVRPNPHLFSPFKIWYDFFCADNNVTRHTLALQTGIFPSQIHYMMRGSSILTMDRILKLSEVMNVDSDILVNLNYIFTKMKVLLNAYPELDKYQEHIFKYLDEKIECLT